MTEFLKGLFGFGTRKLAPIIVAGVRAAASAGLTAFGGIVLTQLSTLDWGDYAPYSIPIMGLVRFLIEGLSDQLKTQVERTANP